MQNRVTTDNVPHSLQIHITRPSEEPRRREPATGVFRPRGFARRDREVVAVLPDDAAVGAGAGHRGRGGTGPEGQRQQHRHLLREGQEAQVELRVRPVRQLS